MKTPKDRAKNPKRSPSNEIERRRAHLNAGGTIGNYDRSHYMDNAPEGWNTLTPEHMDEIDKQAESAHEKMGIDNEVNLLDSSTYGKPPF